MWMTLVLAVAVCLVVLYVPGYVLARSASIARFASVALAPLFSIFLVAATGIVLQKVGVVCSGGALLATAIAVSIFVYIVGKGLRRCMGRRAAGELISVGNAKDAGKAAALYIGVAFVITLLVFLLAIDGPDSFSRNDDTTVHLSMVRGFLETGTYSSLHIGAYLDQGIASSFYPGAWHVVAAIVASFFDDAVPLAANATVVAFTVVVFPLAICLLLQKVCAENRRVILAGSLFAVAFCGFPWMFVVFGQLFPNMVSFMLIPLTLVLLIEAIETDRISSKVKLGVLVGVGLIVIALSQPNGAFTFGIWAVFYSINRMFYPASAGNACVTKKRMLRAIALFTGACMLWAVMFFAPFMQNVVQYTWEATISPLEAIGSGLLFMFTVRGALQPFLSIVVLAGVIYTCKHRRYLWLSAACGLALIMYVIDASTDGVIKQVLTGFWYTDCYRTGAMAAFFAIPLAALGFVQLANLLQSWCVKLFKTKPESLACKRGAVAVLVALFVACQFFPVPLKVADKTLRLGLTKTHHEVETRYSWKKGLTGEEDAFVKKAMELIPNGALVINVPSDGSCWSYGVEGLNTYFRRSSNTGRDNEQESKILRTQLRDVSTSEEVRAIVDNLDARYVLLLDDPTSDHKTKLSLRYKEENWEGIETINEQTPGFTLLLSEDDMRLYQID